MVSINILLVEDNLGDIELIREELAETAKVNYKLNVVNDGEAALDFLFQRGKFNEVEAVDVILLDLHLPKMDGRELLNMIKHEPTLYQIPIIVLSNLDAAIDIKQRYELSENCFMPKPIQWVDFHNFVQCITPLGADIVHLPPEGDIYAKC